MSKYFGDIENVQIYFDDLLICANSRDGNDQIMKEMLNRIPRINIKFNPKKLQYAVFLGFIFNKEGVIPYPDRIK